LLEWKTKSPARKVDFRGGNVITIICETVLTAPKGPVADDRLDGERFFCRQFIARHPSTHAFLAGSNRVSR
jgi:hypothetical protein